MKKLFSTKKRIVAGVLSIAIIASTAGVAFAYFTSTGSGSGSVTTGSATNWTVTAVPATGGPLYPGTGSDTVAFTITNASTGSQALTSETFSVASDPTGVACTGLGVPSGCNANFGDVEATAGTPGTAVSGCLASWYVLTPGTVAPANGTSIVPTTGAVTDSVAVALTNASVSQNSCEGISPAITLAVA